MQNVSQHAHRTAAVAKVSYHEQSTVQPLTAVQQQLYHFVDHPDETFCIMERCGALVKETRRCASPDMKSWKSGIALSTITSKLPRYLTNTSNQA
jgi:hypothetical protein